MWHAWDCLHFIDGAWLSCFGRPLAGVAVRERVVTELGLYKERKALSETFGFSSVDAWMDTVAKRHCGVPCRGAAVLVDAGNSGADRLIGVSFGVCVGSHIATVSKVGVTFSPSDSHDQYWMPQ